MQTMLRSAGHCIVTTPEEADVCILNSCTVTESGDNRTRAALRKLRRSYPDMLLVLTGCYAQAYPEQAESIPEADLVLGTKGRSRLPELGELLRMLRISGVRKYEILQCVQSVYDEPSLLNR